MAKWQRNKRVKSNSIEPDSRKDEIENLTAPDRLLEYFLDEIRKQLSGHLKQIILFGSRARGDYFADSDYDFLAVVDFVSPEIREIVDEVAGKFLFQYNVVFSIFPISEEKYRKRIHEPFLRNIRKEGITFEIK